MISAVETYLLIEFMIKLDMPTLLVNDLDGYWTYKLKQIRSIKQKRIK
jgi:hypothetical protein